MKLLSSLPEACRDGGGIVTTIQLLLGAIPVPKDAQTLLVIYAREKEIILAKIT